MTHSVVPVAPPINVLVVSAGMHDLYDSIAVKDAEMIRHALLPTDRVDRLSRAATSTLSKTLMAGYDLVPLIVQVQPDGSLVLEDGLVRPSHLAGLLDNRGLKCALFMTCNSANVIGALRATNVRWIIAATSGLYTEFSNSFAMGFIPRSPKGSLLRRLSNMRDQWRAEIPTIPRSPPRRGLVLVASATMGRK